MYKKRLRYYIQIKGVIGWYTIKSYSRKDYCFKFIDTKGLILLYYSNELRIKGGYDYVRRG